MNPIAIVILLHENGAMTVQDFDAAVAWSERTGMELRIGTVNPADPDQFVSAKYAIPPKKKAK